MWKGVSLVPGREGVTVCVEGCVPGREGGHCLCGRVCP